MEKVRAADLERFLNVLTRLKRAFLVDADKEVADLLGLSRTALAERKRRGAVPEQEIRALCEPRGVSVEWVLSGKGDARPHAVAATEPVAAAAKAIQALDLTELEQRLLLEAVVPVNVGDREGARAVARKMSFVTAPLHSVRASAGAGAVVDVHDDAVVDVLAFDRLLLRDMGISPARLAVIAVRGDSMADTLQDGDLIIVDTSPPDRLAPGVYVLARDDSLLVKRLNMRANGSVEVRSDNKMYPTDTLSAAEFAAVRIVGRMVRRVVR